MHFTYIGIIVALVSFGVAILSHYTVPRDCSKAVTAAHIVGETKGIRDTINAYSNIR